MASSWLTKIRPSSCSISCLTRTMRKTELFSNSRCLPVVAVFTKGNASESYVEKNKRLGRPTSPHLLIYKFELPGYLSISHRVTGLVQSGVISLAAVGLMFAPENVEYYVNCIQAMDLPRPFVASAKMLFAWPFVFHLFNGVRHLAWDVSAKGLKKDGIYITGYLIFASSLLVTGGLVLAL